MYHGHQRAGDIDAWTRRELRHHYLALWSVHQDHVDLLAQMHGAV